MLMIIYIFVKHKQTINLKDKKMKPSKQLLQQARAKAKATFKPNATNSMKSIRLTADEKSYTLFYWAGMTYIGSYNDELMPDFFKKRDSYSYGDIATMQSLR